MELLALFLSLSRTIVVADEGVVGAEMGEEVIAATVHAFLTRRVDGRLATSFKAS